MIYKSPNLYKICLFDEKRDFKGMMNKKWKSPVSPSLGAFYFLFLISNKDLVITKRERHPSIQEVYRGVQIKYKNYINQENPKKKKKDGFSTLRTSPIRFKKKEA